MVQGDLRGEGSLVISSTGASSQLIISSSFISGRVYADQGQVPQPKPKSQP
jgi:hypothetical protein